MSSDEWVVQYAPLIHYKSTSIPNLINLFHFSGELAESRQTEVTIRDVDELAMEILIEFCYTSHIVVEESNVQTLLPAACLLQLAEIQVIML